MAQGNGTQSGIALAAGIGELEGILSSILAELRSDIVEVAVGDGSGRELVLKDWPVAGSKRIVVFRTGNGFASLAVATTGTPVLPANEARMGLQLTNSGTNPVIVYLADHAGPGLPTVYLAAGASWDGRFGNVTWTGNLYAVAQTGATTLVGGEI